MPAPVLGVLSTITDDYRVAIANLSARGARVSGLKLPAEHAELIFRAGQVQAFGEVAWLKGDECGVAFEKPLTTDELERLRGKARIGALEGLSPEERAAAEEWELGSGR